MTLTAERAREHVDYDPATGVFTRRSTGQPTGWLCKNGYRYVSICRKDHLAHRVAWLLMTGCWPAEIDHRNMDRLDNSWANLREATRGQNSSNRRVKSHSQLGIKGVRRNPRGRFVARIRVAGVTFHLGVFDTPDMAAAAYQAAAQRLHGEFARS
jgi:hypothetical protein